MKTENNKKVKKIDYEKFVELVKKNEFKVTDISYDKLLDDMRYVRDMFPDVKKNADFFNISSVQNLFRELCVEEGRIIDIHTYLDEYMERVNKAILENNHISQLCREKQNVFRKIFKLRGYSAYKSALAEISFKLLCQNILNDKYQVVMNDDLDRILGVDIVLLDREEDVAHYVHVTKDTKFAHNKLKKKDGQVITVNDEREVAFLNDDGQRQYYRSFKGHVLALYDDDENNNKIINGVYLFREEYVRELLDENYGLCDKKQYEELKYLERSKEQIRYGRGNSRITWYED